jgi:acetyltransferase
MAAPAYEVFVGAKKDPEFGPVVLFGSGGILVELFKDVAIRVAPLDARAARRMIEETHAGTLLNGYRGRPPADREALVKFLVRFSRLLVEHPEIVDVDINPLVVSQGHGGCVVVDAKIRIG